MKLAGQIALIIGGARGIGATIADNFSKEGASLVLVDLEKMKTELDAVARGINQNGGKAVVITADCSDDRQVNNVVDETVRRFGKIDVLINSAGFRGPLVAVTEISDKEFDDVILYNLKLVFLCCRAVLKQMVKQKSGSIVSISGTAGREGMAMRGSLCAAKWGVVGFTKSLSMEVGPDNIRVNAIQPGVVEGERIDRVIEAKAKAVGISFEEQKKISLERVSMHRMVSPYDIANMALYLASDIGRNVTGQALSVCAGVEMLG